MKIRNYEKGDIYKLIQNEIDQYSMQFVREDVLMENVALTGLDDNGNIIGSGGFAKLWEGVYEAWIALDERYKKDHVFLFRELKDVLDSMPKHVVRIHAHVNENTENRARLMKLLGFEVEAILENYFPKKVNCILYRRLYQ